MNTLVPWLNRPPITFFSLILLLFAGSLSLRAQSSCSADGGIISLENGGTSTIICADDGVADPIVPVVEGASGSAFAWVITNSYGIILARPAGPPFDLEGAGSGACFIYYLAIGDDFSGDIDVGDNICDLTPADGCFDLSNPIGVGRRTGDKCEDPCEADGGMIALADGEVLTSICVDDEADPLEIVRDGNAVGSIRTFVITDLEGNILAIPDNNGPFDLNGAGPGTCLIWYLAYEEGLSGLEVGLNAEDLDGCFDLSNAVSVVRNEVDGGMITLAGGATDTTICVDGVGDPLEVILDGSAMGSNTTFVITDAEGNILAIPEGNGPFDLDPAGPGTCLIWYLAFEDGLMGAEVGQNAGDLSGCFDLSNPITVVRNEVDGGMITLAGGATDTTICVDGVGDPLEVILDGSAMGSNTTFVITDAEGNILAIPAGNGPFDLDPAGPGTCLIWYLAFEDGLMGAEVGQNAGDLSGCFDLSNPITVVRNEVDGGMITLLGGATDTTICVDGVGDPLEVILDGSAMGSNTTFVITDAEANILAIPEGNGPFDLDPAGPGTCLIWYLAFEDGLMGAEVGQNAGDLSGCFDLSNPITVVRAAAEAGVISLTDGGGDAVTICADDSIANPLDVTVAGAVGPEIAWVITDTNLVILGLPAGPPFDLEGAGAGVCLIWQLSFAGDLIGAEVGENAANLQGCFELSNPIAVTRLTGSDCPGSLTGGVAFSEVGDDGRIEITNSGTETVDISSYWLCNFPTYVQLNNLTVECGSLNLGAGEVVVVSGFSAFNATDAELGLYSDNLFSSSDAIVSYLEWGSAGHQRANVAIAAGIWMEDLFFTLPTGETTLQLPANGGPQDWTSEDASFCEANGVTSTENPNLREVSVTLFPNPAGEMLNVATLGLEAEECTFEIFDQTGRLVTRKLAIDGREQTQIDLRQLRAGSYYLRATDGQRVVTERFIKR